MKVTICLPDLKHLDYEKIEVESDGVPRKDDVVKLLGREFVVSEAPRWKLDENRLRPWLYVKEL